MRPLGLRESLLFSAANFGSNLVYQFINFGAGLYLLAYPAVPAWLVGLLAQERSLAGALVQPAVGVLSDRTRTRIGRRKPFFIVGVGLTAASLLFLGTFPPLVPMLLVLSVNAFFLNVAVDPYLALMADVVPPGQRGRIGAALAVFLVLGAVTATIAGSLLWDVSPELVFVVVAAGLVVAWAVTTVAVREPAAPPAPREPLRFEPARYVRGLLAYPELLKYVAAAAFYWMGTGGVIPYITRFGVKELGMRESESFLLALPALGASVVGAVVAGYAADRIGKKPVLATALAYFAVVAVIGSQAQTVGQAYLAMGVVGVGNGALTAVVAPLLVDLVAPERAAEMAGLGSAVWSLAQPIGALAAGLLIEASGENYRASFVGAGVFVAISFVLLLPVRAPQHRATVTAALA